MASAATSGMANGNQAPFGAWTQDDATHAALARIAQGLGWPADCVTRGGMAEAVMSLGERTTPSLVVVDLSASADPLDDVNALAEVCDPGTKVIALGSVNDVNLFRQLMTLGVEDYLIKPVSAEAMAAAIQRALQKANEENVPPPEEARTSENLGRLMAVVGTHGGVGASTFALGCAWTLAEEMGRKVALLDMDLFFGTLALDLDLEPGRGFREALENPARIDGLFIERAMVSVTKNLSILGAEEDLANPFSFDSDALDLLLEKLRHMFDAVILDMPRFAARTQMALMTPPSTIVLVSVPSLSGMRDTGRLARLARADAADAQLRVVLNKTGELRKGELDAADFERNADVTVDHAIPWDPKSAAAANVEGKSIADVGKRGKAAKAIQAVCDELLEPLEGEDGQAKPSLFKRLLGGRG